MIKKGLAFDIGTTTIAAALVDIGSGKVIKALSSPNPQSRWGSDVVARIEAARGGAGVLEGLWKVLVGECNALLEGFGDEEVSEVTVAGNTVMEHLFLNISPAPLARPPYRPAFKQAKRMRAAEAGIKAGKASLYLFPVIGSFVGGDAVAVALSLGLHMAESATLAIDIGTNSEILLARGGEIFATSAAAGPAFEAGGVRFGMTAGPGAIEGVRIEGDRVSLDVIGGVRPRGICGSGLISAVASLIEKGVVERSGRIIGKDEAGTNLSNRIKADGEGNSFVLYKDASGEITLEQSDVRGLQGAKAAIKAGIDVLLEKARVRQGEIARVYLAGSFGSNLRKEGLRTIGLLDQAWLGKVESAGDAALDGAVLALGNEERKREAEEIAAKARYVPLSGSAHFEKGFIRNMDF